MNSRIRTFCVSCLVVLALSPMLFGPAFAQSAAVPAPKAAAAEDEKPEKPKKAEKAEKASKKSLFSEDGPVDTTWEAQLESFEHSLIRLPLAALLSAMLAFRPRRRGTPKRQAPVIQTQIILAIVGAMVMLVVGASLARAFGIVGAAGLIRYRAKVEDPKDAGVMLSTLAIGLASGVGLYVFALFAAVFVLCVLLLIESIDPAPYLLFDLTVTAKDSASLKAPIEGVLKERRIPYELGSTSEDKITFEVKMPLDIHTDLISSAVMSLDAARAVNVKWEHKKDTK
jgi:uncharacterized membrane protein YhiD involved in acid resistance